MGSISSTQQMQAFISSMMAIERLPLTELESKKSDFNLLSSTFSDLDSKLSSLQSSAQNLTDVVTDVFDQKSSTSSDTSVISGSASTSAVNGAYDITVSQLAKASTQISDRLTSTGTEIVTNVGTGTKSFRVTVNGVDTDVNVTVSSGEDNETILGNISSAINNAFDSVTDPVTASVIKDTETTNKLSIASDKTGQTYKVTLTDRTGTLLSYIGVDDESVQATTTTGGYLYADSQLDANFTVNGIDITRNSNTVSDVITGVTLNLLSVQTSSAVTLTVDANADAIKTDVNDFLSKYNDVVTFLRERTRVDPDTGFRGRLAGDFTYINLRLDLLDVGSGIVSTVTSGNPQSLYEIGITAADDGTLSITDSAEFDSALSADPNKVADLFDTTDGVATGIDSLIDSFVKAGGLIDDKQSSIDNQISNIDDRIKRLEEQLNRREQSLRDEFASFQAALSALSAQQAFIRNFSSILGS